MCACKHTRTNTHQHTHTDDNAIASVNPEGFAKLPIKATTMPRETQLHISVEQCVSSCVLKCIVSLVCV